MRKIGRVLLLSMSALFLLAFLLTTACGSSVTDNVNSSIKTPIERIQSLESGLLSIQTRIDKGILDYGIIQNRVDEIRDDLDTLTIQITEIINYAEDIFGEVTINITILQEIITSLDERMDVLEVTCNAT